MPDREKVMRGLRYCLERSQEKVHCGDCPYWFDDFESGCHVYDMMRDAIELLEVKDVEIKTNAYSWKFYYCPTCGKDFYGFDKRVRFCNQCGQGIRWPEKEDGDA